MSTYTRVLRREYTGNLSLKTTDHCIKSSLLAKFTPKIPKVISQPLTLDNGQFLIEVGNILSSKECAEIIQNADKCIFEDVSDKYRFGKQRNSSRLLALDETLTENVWKSINSILLEEMDKQGMSAQPLGFDVTRGEWELHGLNEAIRINKYSGETKGYFGPHKDAQYCPNGDERSLLTLLIYLNKDFKGGQTCFYFPRKSTESGKGMTIKEEIDLHGGLTKGFKRVKVVPKVGHAVLSSQNILHEALPVTKGTKYILKTDVVVKRHSKEFGFAIEEREKKDYLTCLNYFREAQQQELLQNFNIASDLYEKALSIRYCYPACNAERQKAVNTSGYNMRLPSEVWFHVFRFLSGYDAQNLVYAFPELNVALATWEQRQRSIAPCLSNEKYLPKIRYQKGIVTSFEFPDAEFFSENITACCRVAAMYSFFLLGQSPQDDVYTVRYNPDTRDACVVALETLLSDVFYSQRCYGSIYNVRQQDSKKRDPMRDFEASVDRNYMLRKHGAEFTGVELPDSFYAKNTVYITSDDEGYDDSDNGNEKDDDDDQDDDDHDGDDHDDDDHNDDDHDDHDDDDHDDDDHDGDDDDDHNDDDHDNDDHDDDDPEAGKMIHKRKGVYYHNMVPFYGEVGVVSVDSLLRFLLLKGDQSRVEYELPEDADIMEDVIGEDCMTSTASYFEEIERDGVSAALVSKLNMPLGFQHDELCICFIDGPGEKALNDIATKFSTEYFNHLVFNFQASQLKVEFLSEEYISCSDDGSVESAYEAVVKREIAELNCIGELKYCQVSIESLLSSDTSFNHASCECGNPRFDVHEYYNLKHYPHLTSVAVFAKEKSGKMIVWTVYNGIVAL